jgi:tetratricopeptide (TPR) repeat protein
VTTLPDAEHGQAVLFRSILAVVERLAAGRPIVVVVDDVHLAGQSTLDWLRLAMHRGNRVLILTARRPSPAPMPTLDDSTRLVLPALGISDAEALVGAERAETLHERSAGNPLFLVELAASGDDDLPHSIRELVGQRVESLGPDVAATMRAAAMLGSLIDVDLLAGVLERPLDDLLDDLESAESARVLVGGAGTLRFAHELVREALVASSPSVRRAHHHRRAAAVLAGRATPDPLEVAWHARQAGDLELASASLVDAGRAAADRFDLHQAVRHFDDAVSLADSLPARLERARARMALWDLTAARVDAERAIDLGGGARAFELAGWIAYYQRAHDDARRFADEALARADDPALRASCLALVGRWSHTRGDLWTAAKALEEGVAIAPSGLRSVPAIWLAGVRSHQGRLEESADLAARGVLDMGRIDHPFAPLHGMFSEAVALGALGRIARALDTLDRLDSAVERRGAQARRFGPVASNVRGWLLRNLGRLGAADEQNEIAAALPADEPAFAEPRYVGHLDLVEGCLARDDLDGAVAILDRIADIASWEGSMAWHQRQRYGLQRARIALATDDRETALELSRQVEADARDRGCGRYEVLASVTVARAADDRDAVAAALARADGVAAPEVWWLTAEAAASMGVDSWWGDAAARVDRLVAAAPSFGDELRSHARGRFTQLQR